MEKKRHSKMRVATGSDVKLVRCGCFRDISVMIAAGFVRGTLVTTNGVIETFEISPLRNLFRQVL